MRRARHFCVGSGRRQDSMPGAGTPNAASALYRYRVTRACGARREDIAWTGLFQRLGNSNGRKWGVAFQSDFLSQRLGLAT